MMLPGKGLHGRACPLPVIMPVFRASRPLTFAGRIARVRIVVTGGAGFIGSNFVRRALTDTYPGLVGAEVVVLDALTYSGNLANLAPVKDSERYTFVHGNIRDPEILAQVFRGADAVVHFAAESHVDRSVLDSGIFVETNVVEIGRAHV